MKHECFPFSVLIDVNQFYVFFHLRYLMVAEKHILRADLKFISDNAGALRATALKRIVSVLSVKREQV